MFVSGTICLFFAGFSSSFLSLAPQRVQRRAQIHCPSDVVTRLGSTISNIEISTSASRIQKWYILNEGKRAEVFTSEATSKAAIIAEAWKSVLVSLRVLEADVNIPTYDCIYEFVNVKLRATDDLSQYKKIAESIQSTLVKADPLFQPAFSRSIKFILNPTAGGESLVMVLETTRTKSMMVIFEEIEYSPDVSEEDVEDFSNDLESFPFPTVMDFVSGTETLLGELIELILQPSVLMNPSYCIHMRL